VSPDRSHGSRVFSSYEGGCHLYAAVEDTMHRLVILPSEASLEGAIVDADELANKRGGSSRHLAKKTFLRPFGEP